MRTLRLVMEEHVGPCEVLGTVPTSGPRVGLSHLSNKLTRMCRLWDAGWNSWRYSMSPVAGLTHIHPAPDVAFLGLREGKASPLS